MVSVWISKAIALKRNYLAARSYTVVNSLLKSDSIIQTASFCPALWKILQSAFFNLFGAKGDGISEGRAP